VQGATNRSRSLIRLPTHSMFADIRSFAKLFTSYYGGEMCCRTFTVHPRWAGARSWRAWRSGPAPVKDHRNPRSVLFTVIPVKSTVRGALPKGAQLPSPGLPWQACALPTTSRVVPACGQACALPTTSPPPAPFCLRRAHHLEPFARSVLSAWGCLARCGGSLLGGP